MVYVDMMEAANHNKLNSLERPKQLRILLDPFSIENDLLTPTFKLKRNKAKNTYLKEITEMYEAPIIDLRKGGAGAGAPGQAAKKTN